MILKKKTEKQAYGKNQKTRPKHSLSVFRRLPLLLSLTRRAIFFFMFLTVSQIFLFITGNIQNFLDENLKFILIFCVCSASATAFFSFAAVLECIFYLFYKKKNHFIIHFVLFLIVFVLSTVLAVVFQTITVISEGTI